MSGIVAPLFCVTTILNAPPYKPAAPAPPFDVGKCAGIFTAIGLAAGAIGTGMPSIITGVLALKWWQIPRAFAGLVPIISGPSMAVARFKLRKLNLAPIPDANGWAVNAKAMIDTPFGCTLTSLARLPDGAQCSLQDPFAGKQRPWKAYVIALAAVIVAGLVIWQTGLTGKLIKSDSIKNALPRIDPPKYDTSYRMYSKSIAFMC